MIKARIIIEIREGSDQVFVTGPLNNKTLCFAMLEEAKEVVKKCGNRVIAMPTIKDLKKINGPASI